MLCKIGRNPSILLVLAFASSLVIDPEFVHSRTAGKVSVVVIIFCVDRFRLFIGEVHEADRLEIVVAFIFDERVQLCDSINRWNQLCYGTRVV